MIIIFLIGDIISMIFWLPKFHWDGDSDTANHDGNDRDSYDCDSGNDNNYQLILGEEIKWQWQSNDQKKIK